MYGVEPVENREVVYRTSVQETAKIYYRNLVDFYPKGPYLLLGHSTHGNFTLELARLLISSGKKEVAFIGLLDTYPPGYSRQANPVDRTKIHLINLRDKNLQEILQYARLSAQRFSTRWRRRAALDAKTIERYEQEGNVAEVRSLLLRSYKPEPYSGKVTLFSATNHLWYVRWEPMEQWVKILTGQLDIVSVPGDHMSMFEQPQVGLLAEKIEACLPPD